MSTTVDNRVVSMEFDNKKFEQNVQESLKTLKNLDSTLNGMSDSASKFNNLSFSHLSDAVDHVANHFSLMGSITSEVFSRISSSIVDMATKLGSVSLEGISAGWEKYAEKTTSVQTIMAATGESIDTVNNLLSKLNWYTDETSYNYTDMAGNIAKFTAQDVGLENAVTAMEGIANWAASAGQNATTASRAMYNISQAFGVGAMTAADWKSIELANMATAEFKDTVLETATSMGKLEKVADGTYKVIETGTEVTSKNFRTTLSDRWFDTDVMEAVFVKYGQFNDALYELSDTYGLTATKLIEYSDALAECETTSELAALRAELLTSGLDTEYGSVDDLIESLKKLNSEEYALSKKSFKMAQEAKTFQEAIDAFKDAYSTVWMGIFETIFGNYTKAKTLWTDFANFLYDALVEPINTLSDTMHDAMDSNSDRISSVLTGAGVDLDQFTDKYLSFAKEGGLISDDQASNIKDFESLCKSGILTVDDFKSVLSSLDVSGETEQAKKTVEELYNTVLEIRRGEWSGGSERKKLLEEAGYDYEKMQSLIVKTRAGYKVTEEDLMACVKDTEEITEEQKIELESLIATISKMEDEITNAAEISGRELLSGAFENFFEAVLKLTETIGAAWRTVFTGDAADTIYSMAEGLNKFTESLIMSDEKAEKVQRVFQGLFSILDIGIQIISAAFSAFKDILAALGFIKDDVGDVSLSIADFLTELAQATRENNTFYHVFKRISDVIVRAIGLIKKLRDRLSEIIDKISELQIVKDIRDWLSNDLGLDFTSISSVLSTAGAAISTFAGSISALMDTNVQKLSSKIEYAFAQIGLEEYTKYLDDARAKIYEVFDAIKKFAKTGDSDAFIEDIKNSFSFLATSAEDAREKITNFINSIDFKKLGTAGGIAGLIVAFVGLTKTLQKFSNFLKLRNSLASFFTQLTNGVKFMIKNVQANYVIKIALAIAILAGSVALLAIVGNKYDLTLPIAAIMGMLIGLTVIMAIMKGIAKGGGEKAILNGALLIVSLGAALMLCVGALLLLQGLVITKDMLKCLLTIAGIIVFLGFIGVLISRFSGAGGGVFNVLALAASLVLVAIALEKIQSFDLKSGWKSLVVLLAVLVVLAIVSRTMKDSTWSASLGIVLFLASILIIEILFDRIVKNAPSWADIKSNISQLGALFVLMIAIAVVMRIAGKSAKGALKGSGGFMFALVAALVVFVWGIKSLANMDIDEILKGTLPIIALLAALALVFSQAGKLSGMDKNSIKSITMIVIALGVLVAAIFFLQNIPIEKLAKVVGALVILMLAFALTVRIIAKSSSSISNTKALIGIMLGIIVMLGLVVGSIYAIQKYGDPNSAAKIALSLAAVIVALGIAMKLINAGKVPKFKHSMALLLEAIVLLLPVCAALWAMTKWIENPEHIIKIAFSISMILVALGVAMGALNKIGTAPTAAQAGTICLEAIALLLPICAALWAMTKWIENPDHILEITLAMSLILIALSAAMFIMSKANVNLTSAGSFAIASLSLVIIAASLVALNNVNVEGLAGKVIALCAVLLAMSGAMLIASKIPNAGTALANMGAITAAIVVILAIVVALSDLMAYINSKNENAISIDRITAFFDMAVAVFDGIGRVIGSFASGLLEGLTSNLSDIASNIMDFIFAMDPVIAAFNAMDDTTGSKVDAFANLIASISGLSITSLFTSDNTLEKFASNLESFGEGVKKFGDKVKGVDSSGVETACTIANTLSGVNKGLFGSGGFLQKIIGEKDLGKFGETLEPFADGVVKFAEKVAGLTDADKQNVDNSVEIGNKMISMASGLKRSGGLVDDLLGSADLETFGGTMTAFATSLTTFCGSIQGITKADVTQSELFVKVAQPIIDMAATIQRSGGTISEIFGNNSLSYLGTNLTSFATSINNFVTKYSGIEDTALNTARKAKNMTAYLVEAVTMVIDSGTSKGNTSSKISKFASSVSDLVEAFSELEIDDGTSTNFAASLSATIWTVGEFETKFIAILDEIYSKWDEKWEDIVETTRTNSEELTGVLTEITSGIDSDELSSSMGTSLLNSLYTIDYSTPTNHIGEVIGSALVNGFIAGVSRLIPNMQTKLNILIGVIRGYYSRMHTAGAYLVQGFINGIDSKIEDLEEKAKELAKLVAEIVEMQYKIDSPSKVMMELGEYIAEGYAIGIGNNTPMVESAATNMSNAVMLGMGVMSDGVSGIVTNMSDKLSGCSTMFDNLVPSKNTISSATSFINTLSNNISSIDVSGTMASSAVQVGGALSSSFSNVVSNLTNTVSSGLNQAVGTVRSYASGMYSAGYYLGLGLVQGLDAVIPQIESRVNHIASLAEEAIRYKNQINSPSKVMMKLGEYIAEGYAIGIDNKALMAESAANDMSDKVISTATLMADAISEAMENDISPVITPVLDLSNVNDGLSGLDKTMSVSTAANTVKQISSAVSSLKAEMQKEAAATEASGNTVIFNQTNNSPKTLSRTEIYRLTKNQLDTAKGYLII